MPRKKSTTVIKPPRRSNLYNAAAEKEKNAIGVVINTARKEKDLTLEEFSRYLEYFGITVGVPCISKWESGLSIPTGYQLLALCDALDIRDIRAHFSMGSIPDLNDIGLKKLEAYKQDLIASGRYMVEQPKPVTETEIVRVSMPVCDLHSSGSALDENSFGTVSFPASSVPADADFGLRVPDRSMEPVYCEGQTVWIQKTEKLTAGTDGFFFYNGEGYLKCYGEQNPEAQFVSEYTDADGRVHLQPVLISYGEGAEPLPVSPYLPFKILGKVLKP